MSNQTAYSLTCTILITTAFMNNCSIITSTSLTQCQTNKRSQMLSDSIPEYPLNDSVESYLEKGKPKRYYFTLNDAHPLTLNFSTCSSTTFRKLFYNQTLNLSRHLKPNFTSFVIPCAPSGRYDLVILSKGDCKFRINTSSKHPYSNSSLIKHIEPSRVRYQNRIKKRQLFLKWDKSKLDIHAMHYCLTINTEKNQKNLCTAAINSIGKSVKELCPRISFINNFFIRPPEKIVKIDNDMVNVACTGLRNRQIFKGLIPYKQYFIDIFALHSNLNNLTFLLKSTTLWFNRTRPIILSDKKITIGKLVEFGRQSIFSYKVPQNVNNDLIKFQVIPCGDGVIIVKIFKNKEIIKEFSIYRSSVMKLHGLPGDRFIMKISPGSDDERRRSRKIGVSVTTDNHFRLLPDLPSNTTLHIVGNTCRSTTIAWYASSDPRDIRYCIILIKLMNKNDNFADGISSNMCDLDIHPTSHPQFNQMHCFGATENRPPIEKFKLVNLTPGGLYSIHVIVSLNNYSLPYDFLKLNKSRYCFDNIYLMGRTELDKQKNNTIFNDNDAWTLQQHNSQSLYKDNHINNNHEGSTRLKG